MGRSLRRAKRFRPVQSTRSKRKKQQRAPVPVEISAHKPDLKQKLNIEPTWDSLKNYSDNYEAIGFVDDPNAGFGRNTNNHELEVCEFDEHDPVEPEDDDFRAVLSLQRRSGKAPLPKLTAHQQQIMQRLVEAHGDDVAAMVKDRKLNKMLLPASRLKVMLQSLESGHAHNFRAPVKHNRHH